MPERTTALRVLASELNDATHHFKEDEDDDKAPVWALLPTGAKANRVFMAGVLTETEDVGTDGEYWKARVTDFTGDAFFAYAGEYQPEAKHAIKNLDAPAFVGIVGKPSAYETDNGTVNVSVKPECVFEASESYIDRWAKDVAEQTMERIDEFNPADDEIDRAAVARYGGDLEQYLDSIASAANDRADESEGEYVSEPEDDAGQADADDGLSREELHQMDYQRLRGIASTVEGVNGNAAHDTLVEQLAGETVPVSV